MHASDTALRVLRTPSTINQPQKTRHGEGQLLENMTDVRIRRTNPTSETNEGILNETSHSTSAQGSSRHHLEG